MTEKIGRFRFWPVHSFYQIGNASLEVAITPSPSSAFNNDEVAIDMHLQA